MERSPRSSGRIAVVDDDQPTRALIREILADTCSCVVLWPGNSDPVAFVAETRPDLVILDLHIGGEYQAAMVIDALCGDRPTVGTPVIICSADEALLRRDGAALRERGCVILPTPFNIDEFIDLVQRRMTPRTDGRLLGDRIGPDRKPDRHRRT